MKALVTGAGGFVGYSLAKELLASGFTVKAMVRGRAPRHLEGLQVEICRGDLCDKDSLMRALAGCRYLFHVAAHYSLWEKDPGIIYRANVEGTKNILTLAAENSLERIVYTSSVATIKPSADEKPADENTATSLTDIVGHYKRSKYLAEQEAKKIADQGAPLVIVNPSAPIGPYDAKPTPTGKIIVDFLRGKMFGYLHTGLNLVAVEDVARGHILAARHGKKGERYILGNENLYLIDIFRMLEKVSGVPAPNFKVPYVLAYGTGLMSEMWARLRGKPPAVPLDGVRMARKCMFFDSAKAMRDLGYNPSPVEGAIERAVTWFRENNYV